MRHLGNEITLIEDGRYFPNKLIINGEVATMEAYAEAHAGKNWRSTPSGNILMYRTETGKEYTIPQTKLMKED